MIRLIVFIVIFIIFLAFIILNLGNKSDVSFGVKTFSDIPVFLTAFSSFILGMLFTLPIVLSRRKGKKQKKSSGDPLSNLSDSSGSAGGLKKRRGRKNKNSSQAAEKNDSLYNGTDDIKKENSPYGID